MNSHLKRPTITVNKRIGSRKKAIFQSHIHKFADKKTAYNESRLYYYLLLKLRCDTRFERAFTACGFILKVITLVGSNQSNYFENATA